MRRRCRVGCSFAGKIVRVSANPHLANAGVDFIVRSPPPASSPSVERVPGWGDRLLVPHLRQPHHREDALQGQPYRYSSEARWSSWIETIESPLASAPVQFSIDLTPKYMLATP